MRRSVAAGSSTSRSDAASAGAGSACAAWISRRSPPRRRAWRCAAHHDFAVDDGRVDTGAGLAVDQLTKRIVERYVFMLNHLTMRNLR
jgi:hypothetical protein